MGFLNGDAGPKAMVPTRGTSEAVDWSSKEIWDFDL